MTESPKRKRTIADILALAGGPKAISEVTGKTADGVTKWVTVLNNIPEPHWEAIKKLARRNGIELTAEDFHEANKRARRKAAREARKSEKAVA